MTSKPEDILILETTRGPVKIAMRPDLAPGHCARIKELARNGDVTLLCHCAEEEKHCHRHLLQALILGSKV